MDDFNTHRDVESRFAEVRTWLVVHGAFAIASVLILTKVSRTREILGMILLFFTLLAEVVRLMYHRADKAYNRVAAFFESSKPPCAGVFGTRGVTSSFIFFYLYLLMYGAKIFSMWASCGLHGEQLQGDGWTIVIFAVASLFWLVAVFQAEMARQMVDSPVI